jgi:arylsulfatase A-like enzyme
VRPFLSLLAVLTLQAAGRPAAAADRPPNLVVLVADDLGWADVGYHGSSIRTPNLDRMAGEGVRLQQHYVASMCSATRSALLSGRYWSRFGVTGATNDRVYPFDTVTLAGTLQSVGYETAITGKWHLGSKPEWGPQKFGFDHSHGSLAGGVGPWNHRYKLGPYTETWHRNDELTEEEGHVTDLIAREAVRWIEARGEKPFFLYVPFTAPHIPIDEPSAWVEQYPEIDDIGKRQYAAAVSHLDDSIGGIVAALERTGSRDNTLVLFFSDNGATPNVRNDDPKYPGTYPAGRAGGGNHPLRGQKAQLYEGGIRVPALVHWPGRLKPGVLDAPVHVVDWMPTLCQLAGYRPARDLKWDGRDVWPLISGQTSPEPRTLYWAGVGFRSAALRHGDWKLVVHDGSPQKVELFDLARDPHEQNDLSMEHPDRTAELQRRLAETAAADRDAAVAGD